MLSRCYWLIPVIISFYLGSLYSPKEDVQQNENVWFGYQYDRDFHSNVSKMLETFVGEFMAPGIKSVQTIDSGYSLVTVVVNEKKELYLFGKTCGWVYYVGSLVDNIETVDIRLSRYNLTFVDDDIINVEISKNGHRGFMVTTPKRERLLAIDEYPCR